MPPAPPLSVHVSSKPPAATLDNNTQENTILELSSCIDTPSLSAQSILLLIWERRKVFSLKIENAFARDLGGIIQFCMGYRLLLWAPWRITTLRAWLLLYAAGTKLSCIDHHGEGEHQYLGHHRVCCGRPAAAAAALGKTNSGMNMTRLQQYQNNLTGFFLTKTAASSSCSVRARAPCWSSA